MHLKCRQNASNVDKETVRLLLKVLDPEGVEDRRRHRLTRRLYRVGGPNFIWHMDSYDKLKPYGICINGCIDGFSRYVTWLEAYSTSSDPKVIAGYYTTAIDKLGGNPVVVRSDFGTENSHVMQMFLRRNGNDEFAGNQSFISGTSVHNQRIECWWGMLRKHCVQYWRNMFQVLKENGEFSGDIMDIALTQFCFLNIIQDELDVLVYEWNNHKISRSNQAEGPFGRPFVMHSTPQMYGVENYLVPKDDIGLNLCKEECVYKSKYPCDKDFFDFFTILMVENNLSAPENPDRALDLYRNLRILALDVL